MTRQEKRFSNFQWCVLAIVLAFTLWNFTNMFKLTAFVFNSPHEDLQHGWALPFVSAFFIWRKRKELAEAAAEPSWEGAALALLFLVPAWIGKLGRQYRLEQIAFIGLLWSFPYAFWGRRVARLLAFPIGFLLFAMPVVTFFDLFTVHLRMFSATAAAWLLNGLGVMVEQAGTAICSHLPGATFNVDVADPCSGIRSLLALIALAAAYAYLWQKTLFGKLALFACAMPVAAIGNMLRIMSICLVARFFGQDVATGYYHDYSGYVVFLIGLWVLMGLNTLLNKRVCPWLEARVLRGSWIWMKEEDGKPAAAAASARTPRRADWMLTGTLAAAVIAVFIAMHFVPPPVFVTHDFFSKSLPDKLDDFTGDVELFCHNDQCLKRFYASKLDKSSRLPDGRYACPSCGGPLELISLGEATILPKDTSVVKHVYCAPNGAIYSASMVISGYLWDSIHRPERCLRAQGFQILATEKMSVRLNDAGKTLTIRRLKIRHPDEPEFYLVYWFESNHRSCCTHLLRMWIDIWDRSIHNRVNRWVMITLNIMDNLDTEDGRQRLETFLSEFYPKVIAKGKGDDRY